MTKEQFESLLDLVAAQLTEESRQNLFTTSKAFENGVREVLEQLGDEYKIAFVRGDIALAMSAMRGTKFSSAAPGTVTGRPPAIFTISL